MLLSNSDLWRGNSFSMKPTSLLSEVANFLSGGSQESSEEKAVVVQYCREGLIKVDVKQALNPDCQLLTDWSYSFLSLLLESVFVC